MTKEWHQITDAEKIARLYVAVETMAAWLVNAQTGFGKRDAEGIFRILDEGPADERKPKGDHQ